MFENTYYHQDVMFGIPNKQGEEMELFNSRELANYLRISHSTVKAYRCKHPDRLPPAFLLNGQYRWDREAVDRWIADRAGQKEARA